MDDVAKDLGISKKTIYQYVTDKDDLVRKTITLHVQAMDVLCKKVTENENNAILQILKIADLMISMHKEMNQSLLFDLKKYHPDTYSSFTEHREKTIIKELTDNIQLGIEQGIYRKEINMAVTTGFYMVLVEACLDTNLQALSSLSFGEKYNYLIDYHMNAICTPLGLQFLKEFKSKSTFQIQ